MRGRGTCELRLRATDFCGGKADITVVQSVTIEVPLSVGDRIFVDEKGNDATLTEKGCEALSPNDPEAYVLPDLISQMADLDGNNELTDKDRVAQRQEMQNRFA